MLFVFKFPVVWYIIYAVDSLEMEILVSKTGSAVFTLIVRHLPLVMRNFLVVQGLVIPSNV